MKRLIFIFLAITLALSISVGAATVVYELPEDFDGNQYFGFSFTALNWEVRDDVDREAEDFDYYRDSFYTYPVTTTITDENDRSMVIRWYEVLESTMDEAIFELNTPPGEWTTGELYLGKPGTYTFTLNEGESGRENHLWARWHSPNPPISWLHPIFWGASLLSDGDSITFVPDGDEFHSVIFKRSNGDKNFSLTIWHYGHGYYDDYSFDIDTCYYDMDIRFEMRNDTTTITKVEGGVIIDGASSYTLDLVPPFENGDYNEIKFPTVEIGHAKVFIDQVTGEVTFLTFSDVPEDSWYYDAVCAMKDTGLMNGISEKDFAPEAQVSRAMAATMLHRMAQSPEPKTTLSFEDVAGDSYYQKAVAWCAESGIITGYSETDFAPEESITRQQLATMLMRYLDMQEIDINILPVAAIDTFSDYGEISEYAIEAMARAVEYGIISGKSGGVLDPSGTATRAEVAVIMSRFLDLLNTSY